MTVTVQWNDEQVDLLKRMWREGASASEVARAIGSGATRSGVIGKVHRLKLPKRTGLAIRQASREGRRETLNGGPSVRSEPRRGRTGGTGQTKAPRLAMIRSRRNEPFRAGTPLPEESEEGVDVTRLLGIMELRDDTCRWPIGDPLEPGFGYCGHHVPPVPEGQRRPPYCEHHQQRARIRL